MGVKAQILPYLAELREWRKLNGLNQAGLAQLLDCSRVYVQKIESLRCNPGPELRQKILDITGLPEETLFPAWQIGLVNRRFFKGLNVEVPQEQLIKQAEKEYARMLPPPKSLHQQAAEKEMSALLERVLDTLSPREQRVIRMRFGLDDGVSKTLEQVGKAFGVTRERVRQIEAKALRKLRHPTRARCLKDFLDDGDDITPVFRGEERVHQSSYRLHLKDLGCWECKSGDIWPDDPDCVATWEYKKQRVTVSPQKDRCIWDVAWQADGPGVRLFSGHLPQAIEHAHLLMRIFPYGASREQIPEF